MNNTPQPPAEYSIAVDIPSGYYPLPLENIDSILEGATGPITESAPSEIASSVPDVIGVLGFFLEALAARQAVYCGIGRHASETGQQVTSWLTISLLNCGEPQNPRLIAQELVINKLHEEPTAIVEAVDVDGRPMVFSELTRSFPAPDLPAFESRPADVAVFQLEALVPSDDGTTVAVIEFSTVSVESGPLYSEMLFTLAASIQFNKLTPQHSSLNL